jgi:hypothetical protein
VFLSHLYNIVAHQFTATVVVVAVAVVVPVGVVVPVACRNDSYVSLLYIKSDQGGPSLQSGCDAV